MSVSRRVPLDQVLDGDGRGGGGLAAFGWWWWSPLCLVIVGPLLLVPPLGVPV